VIVSQWRDERAKTHRMYVQLTPGQAERIIQFLQHQLEEGSEPMELNERGTIEMHHKAPEVEAYKGLITIVIV
jgi:hypothetical protein